jgi:hypothetical protein
MPGDDPQIRGDGWMRASDRDRDTTVSVLRDAYTAGRLDLGELRDRTAAVYTARTWDELRKVIADLPGWPDQARWVEELRAKTRPSGGTGGRPSRPFAPMALMGLVWLCIAAAAPMPAAAIPLVLLALFALWAARWKAGR